MNYKITQPPFPNGTYILFDDDCGVCTKFSHLFKQILGKRADLIPMHIPQVERLGMRKIPNHYWTSFHIVNNGRWTTEDQAIIELAGLFPGGRIWSKVAQFPPLLDFFMFILRKMQATRKAECKVDFSDH